MGVRRQIPELLKRIAEATSEQAMRQLAEEIGGTRLWIPQNPTAESKLSLLIGLDHARAFVKKIGWGSIEIPMGPFRGSNKKRNRILQLRNRGFSAREIALALETTERDVYRHLAAARRDGGRA